MSNPNLILVCGHTPDYRWGRAFHESLDRHCNIPFRIFTIGVDLEPQKDVPLQCIAGGCFLEHLDLTDDPVVIYSDSDMILQRPFSDEEIRWLENMPKTHLEVSMGENIRPKATLKDELTEMGLLPSDEMEEVFPGWSMMPVYNTGVIAARASTYNLFYGEYREEIEDSVRLVPGRTVNQWLQSYLSHSYDLVPMPKTFHCHDFYADKTGIEFVDGIVKFEGQTVALAHHFHLP